jgi:hypothetical protein
VLLGSVGPRLATTGCLIGRAQHQAQVAALQHGKGRRRMHDLLEAKMLALKRNRCIDVMNDVTDLHGSHGFSPPGLFPTLRRAKTIRP